MRRTERARGFAEPVQSLSHRRRRRRVVQRPPVQELHREIERVAVLADVEHGDDVGVLERRDGARLAKESSTRLVAGDPANDLERDRAMKPGVECRVHDTHASAPKSALDAIAAELFSGSKLVVRVSPVGHGECGASISAMSIAR